MHGGELILKNAEGSGTESLCVCPQSQNRGTRWKSKSKRYPRNNLKTLIGGQALIEGILMRGPDKRAIVVRGRRAW